MTEVEHNYIYVYIVYIIIASYLLHELVQICSSAGWHGTLHAKALGKELFHGYIVCITNHRTSSTHDKPEHKVVVLN